MKIVTLKEVEQRLEEIKAIAWDDEVAHIKEDELFYDVVYTIASGKRGGKQLAAEVLKSLDIGFVRWHA
ncbi:MAG: hypothetical protein M0R06_01315 [Sphaerochaeta sp.]|jgi:hypothetical protein|nr:hypothetical protein [Sphaerochaeta sp.]